MCPHFREWHVACCVAGEHGVVLMPFMRQTYCVSQNYRNCPFCAFTDGMTNQTMGVYLNDSCEFDQGGLDARDDIAKQKAA